MPNSLGWREKAGRIHHEEVYLHDWAEVSELPVLPVNIARNTQAERDGAESGRTNNKGYQDWPASDVRQKCRYFSHVRRPRCHSDA